MPLTNYWGKHAWMQMFYDPPRTLTAWLPDAVFTCGQPVVREAYRTRAI